MIRVCDDMTCLIKSIALTKTLSPCAVDEYHIRRKRKVVSESNTKLVVNILFNIDSLEFSQMISSNHTAKLHDLAFSCRTLSSKKSWSSSQNASITGREYSSRSCFVHSNRSLKNFRTTSAEFNERCSQGHTLQILIGIAPSSQFSCAGISHFS